MSFFGIGIYNFKHECNVGTLFRTAYAFNANFLVTIGRKYKRQSSDVINAVKHIPYLSFEYVDQLILPRECQLVGVELTEESEDLSTFTHPDNALYLLGAEVNGLSKKILNKCHKVVQIPNLKMCLNVATAGSIVLYDRKVKQCIT